jgi:hypothetical protein
MMVLNDGRRVDGRGKPRLRESDVGYIEEIPEPARSRVALGATSGN